MPTTSPCLTCPKEETCLTPCAKLNDYLDEIDQHGVAG